MAVELEEWIKRLSEEYLDDFIPSGGAAVRVVVAPEADGGRVVAAVERVAKDGGYFVASVDASQVRTYRIDHIFHAVAREVDWERDIDGYLRRVFDENGVKVAETSSLGDMEGIAEANGRIARDLLNQAERLITNSILRNYALCREMRTACGMLCRATYNPQDVVSSDADVIKMWLLGEKCSLTALKRLQIYQRIGRHNARLMLSSLALWLREVGHRGLALVLDLNAVVAEPPVSDAQVRYTRGTALDTYELLRQFIDGTDELSHLLVIAVFGPGLLDHPKRSLDHYMALKMRLVDDVHDRDYRNPLNAMVRLDARGIEGGEGCAEIP